MPRPSSLSLLLCCTILLSACAEPPNKELHQAQGAIDAARSAGADDYAPEELKAATDALAKAEAAVAQRDYRLALNHALDSRERAQDAAKMAASQKAAMRSQAERLLAEVTSVVAVASARLEAASKGAGRSRKPDPAVEALRSQLAIARTAVDEAGKALANEDYIEARNRLTGVALPLRSAVQALPEHGEQRPARRGR